MKRELVNIFNKDDLSQTQKPLVVFDIANNHNGDIGHGLKIIKEIHGASKEFKDDFLLGFKFQYRDLDSFIHPDYKDRLDVKYVKRFSDTRLSEENFKLMKSELDNLGFLSICTPFDENNGQAQKERAPCCCPILFFLAVLHLPRRALIRSTERGQKGSATCDPRTG